MSARVASNGAAGPPHAASYHGQPALKEPVWSWEIPCYFFTGGLGGASAGLAYLSELRSRDVLARRAWAVALAGIGVSPVLLVSDLGRPSRFLNMLRMFKVTSPMSVGTWILSATGAATAIAAARSWLGLFPRLSRVARPTAALLGLPLSTYTAALITNTAVPAWHDARRVLPFVFGAGAGLSAGAAAVIATPPEHAAPARRLAVAGAAAELAAEMLMERRLGVQARPYQHGAAARAAWLARGGLVAGAALLLARGARSRGVAAAAGGLLLTGAMSGRWSVFKAGFGSVADPDYVLGAQRRTIDEGTRRGAARAQPRTPAAS